jgi:hypothetical protein
MISHWGVTSTIAVIALVIALTALVRSSADGRASSRKSQRVLRAKPGVTVIEEHEEIHKKRIVKSTTDIEA